MAALLSYSLYVVLVNTKTTSQDKAPLPGTRENPLPTRSNAIRLAEKHLSESPLAHENAEIALVVILWNERDNTDMFRESC